MTDNEIFPKDSPHYDPVYRAKRINLVRGTLIMDTTYTDEEYLEHVGQSFMCSRSG